MILDSKKIEHTLKILDLSMKALHSRLIMYHNDDPQYKQTLCELSELYKECRILLSLTTYRVYFNNSDLNEIEKLLTDEGYLEAPSKLTKHL